MNLKSKQQFSKNLKQEIEKCGITQAALAKELGISYQTVSAWICLVCFPSKDNLGKLANALDTTVDNLLWQVEIKDNPRKHYLNIGKAEHGQICKKSKMNPLGII